MLVAYYSPRIDVNDFALKKESVDYYTFSKN